MLLLSLSLLWRFLICRRIIWSSEKGDGERGKGNGEGMRDEGMRYPAPPTPIQYLVS